MEKIPILLSKNGFLYLFRVIYIYFILPVIMKVLRFCLGHPYYKEIKRLQQQYNVEREFRYWQARKAELLKLGASGYRLKIEELGLQSEQLNLFRKSQRQSPEVVIADIDQDGFLMSYFGPIKNVPTISPEQFLARKRFTVKVVAVNGYVGVKKDYHGRKSRFINEIKALHKLQLAKCNVPAILDVDFDNLILIFSFIPGPVLREKLAKQGASILRDRELRKNPDYLALSQRERIFMRAEEGRRVLYEVVDSQFVEKLFVELSKIHAAGITGSDIKYGNVIIEQKSGEPYWIDFERPNYYTNLRKESFRVLRDQDIDIFNQIFGSNKLTYAEIKKRIERKRILAIQDWQIPVHFSSGLYLGSLWNVEAGYGCWHYLLKHHLPSLSGKRVLDLEANNAFYSLQMLRQGAREIIGIEMEDKYIAQGKFVQAAFEWADNTRYNFHYIKADVSQISFLNVGEFDLVMALSPGRDFAQLNALADLIQYLSAMTGALILQGDVKSDIYKKLTYLDKQKLIEDAAQTLKDNGFPITEVIWPRGYNRPLIIARKEQ